MKTTKTYPALGFGIGLRPPCYEYILNERPAVDWFEFISEDYLVPGGRPYYFLEKIRAHYPMVMHGVSLSIGTSDPVNKTYLANLRTLADRIQPAWISDHFCWTGLNGTNYHDLLPLPYTQACIDHIVPRIQQVQDYLGRRIALENVSSYINYQASEMTEWEFITQVAKQADCLVLLDVNNVYVSSYNHDFDPIKFLDGIPVERVQQFHLAGHTFAGDYIVDTHDHAVIPEVWSLYEYAVRRFGNVSALLERDDHIPKFPELEAELAMAKQIASQVMHLQEKVA